MAASPPELPEDTPSHPAADRWRRELEAWAIPDEILAAAPESPFSFPTALFEKAAARSLERDASVPSRRAALEALSGGEAGGGGLSGGSGRSSGSGGSDRSVLDVGAGAGAASLPLAPPAERLVAVDQSTEMLAAYAQGADRRGLVHEEIAGTWPEVASATPVVDVVVCHHVAYNVQDIRPFLLALTAHARRRVVLEVTAAHPVSDLSPLWKTIHGIDRPEGPTADDLAAVVAELGYEGHLERFSESSLWDDSPLEVRVAFARRRLCVGPEHDEEIAAFFSELDRAGSTRELATLWWDAPSR